MKTKKKNLLIVAANGLGRTGVPNVIYQVADVLHNNFEVDVVVFNNDDYYAKPLKNFGVNIIKTNLSAPKASVFRILWRFFLEHKLYKKTFNKIFKNKKYEVIHSFKEFDSGYIFEIAAHYGVKDMFIHCNNEIHGPKNLLARYFYNKKIKLIQKHTTKFIGVSSQCCKVTYPESKFEVLFNSYNEKAFNEKNKNCLESDELVLTQVGTFCPRKNQLFSIDLAKIISQSPLKFRLILIGVERKDGYLERMLERIKELHIEEFVSIIDGNSDFYKIFEHTTYLLLPSISEAAPISLVEAQACGIKCFASNNVTRDVDCGGIIYSELKCDEWFSKIISAFNVEHNTRKKYNTDKFSKHNFVTKLKKIYSKYFPI